MGKEIEHKFLLDNDLVRPVPLESVRSNIKQAYLFLGVDKHVRVRIINNELAVLGIKYTDGLVRDEFEYEIPLEDAKELFGKSNLTIEKKRQTFHIGDEQYDIDTFPNGLVTVEVEFKSLDAVDIWVKPNWLGMAVTTDERYSNITLARENMKF